jgi:hypothetical protein
MPGRYDEPPDISFGVSGNEAYYASFNADADAVYNDVQDKETVREESLPPLVVDRKRSRVLIGRLSRGSAISGEQMNHIVAKQSNAG